MVKNPYNNKKYKIKNEQLPFPPHVPPVHPQVNCFYHLKY